MGYFYCGTEGADYEENLCTKCVHNRNKEGCPVWGLHLLFNYDQFKKDSEGEALMAVLDMLIPRDESGNNLECSMFIPLTELKPQPAPAPAISPEQARTFWVAP